MIAPDGASEGQANWGIIGHGQAVGLLHSGIASGRISHAYLMTGPRQTGKTTLALAFARALNCTGTQPPCGTCRPCRLIAKGTHPDVRLLRLGGESGGQPAEGRARRGRVKNIGMEEVRAVLRDAMLAPYEGRWKVYIVRYAEDLSMDGIQALLKTLEEPPVHVVLILTTVDAKILPPTVVSRCQRLSLGPVPVAEIERGLREQQGGADEVERIAHLSGGRVGWAIEALGNPSLIEARARSLGAFLASIPAGRVERLAYAERIAAEFGRSPEATLDQLELWLCWWRDVLLAKHGGAERVVNHDRQRELREHADRFATAQVVAAMEAIKATLRQLQQNVNPRMALEVLMLGLPAGTR